MGMTDPNSKHSAPKTVKLCSKRLTESADKPQDVHARSAQLKPEPENMLPNPWPQIQEPMCY